MLTLSCGLAFGQPAASKAAAATSNVQSSVQTGADTALICTATTPAFSNAIQTTIKPPGGQSELLVTFSAQTLLLGSSVNVDASTLLPVATSTSENVAIQVRLLVDGIPAFFAPGVPIVTLDNLIKTTSLRISPENVTHTLGLLLQVGGARSLTWAVPNVGNGEHTVTVQSRFCFSNEVIGSFGTSSFLMEAIGPSTLIVEGVKINNF